MVAKCKGIPLALLTNVKEGERASLEGAARVLSSMIVRPRTPPGVGTPAAGERSFEATRLRVEVEKIFAVFI
jgi:hypothetical protein